VAAHYFHAGRSVRGAAGSRLDYGGDFAEVVRTKDAGGHNRQHFRLAGPKIVEAMDSSARDAEHFPWPNVGLSPSYDKGQDAREPVDSLLIVVMTDSQESRITGNVPSRRRRSLRFDDPAISFIPWSAKKNKNRKLRAGI
jgi:hypothetical protein